MNKKGFEERISDVYEHINDVNKCLDDVNKCIADMKNALIRLEYSIRSVRDSEEVTREQKHYIKRIANKKVISFLDLPEDKSKWSADEQLRYRKYGAGVHNCLYDDVKSLGHLGHTIRRTKMCNYSAAIEDIESWYPTIGKEELLRMIDEEIGSHSMNANPEPIKRINVELRVDGNEICTAIKSRGDTNATD